MHNNALLRKLGFDAQDRVVIIHADDIGMCQATLSALADLVDAGLVSSGSVMVPCPWFPEAAAWCRNYPAVDIGVHLTLTCEWDGYRWGPLSTRDPASGLLDEEGHFHRRRQSLWQQASPDAVRVEMQTQVERARKAGLDLTHLDCHMFAAMEKRFMPHYIRLGYDHGLPVLMVRQGHVSWGSELLPYLRQWRAEGLPTFDALVMMDLKQSAHDRLAQARRAFDDLPSGLTCFLIHPARDTPELRAMAPDWRCRVADYETFLTPTLCRHVRNAGIHIIGYRVLRDMMRANLPRAPMTDSTF
jgi:chitin disaccharide deacetylase